MRVLDGARDGRAGKKNGELLRLAAGQFDVLLTSGRNLSFQRNLPGFSIAVIVPHANTDRLESLAPLMPAALEAISSVEAGKVVHVG
jgi:hypothetical protein